MSRAGLDREDARVLRCMEIWGGNDAFDDAIAVSGINAWVYSRPYGGHARGGDIHYVSTCGHGHIARFAVADVSGHGSAAGETAARLRKLMRRNINQFNQTRLIRALNKGFSQLASSGTFATAVFASYYAPSDHLLVCNAGHPPPLWRRARKRRWEFLRGDADERVERLYNLPLGVIEPTPYEQFAVLLERDDLVLIHTDWLIEASSPDGVALGEEGLLRLLAGMDGVEPARLCHDLVAAVSAYRGEAPAADDVTLMLLHHTAADPPRRSIGEIAGVLGKVLGVVRV